MADKKQAKFFCENCGAEVAKDARMCRHCGRFFSSVRCPQCGTTGSASKFARGCPKCGYAVGGSSFSDSKNRNIKSNSDKKASRNSKRKLLNLIDSKSNRPSHRGDESLPFWIYILVGIVLMGILALFVKTL